MANLPKLSKTKPIEIAIDSSGLKISGEGEWEIKIHGADKRRNWIKVHIGVDTRAQDLVAAIVTDEKTFTYQTRPVLETKAASALQAYANFLKKMTGLN
jgi:hypothetical protein